jgi:hypothetical protein
MCHKHMYMGDAMGNPTSSEEYMSEKGEDEVEEREVSIER